VAGNAANGGLQQDQRFDGFGFGAAAAAMVEIQVSGDQAGELQRAESAGGRQEPGMGAGHLDQGAGIELEGGFGLSW